MGPVWAWTLPAQAKAARKIASQRCAAALAKAALRRTFGFTAAGDRACRPRLVPQGLRHQSTGRTRTISASMSSLLRVRYIFQYQLYWNVSICLIQA